MRDAVKVGNRRLNYGGIRQLIHGHMLLDVCDVPGAGSKAKTLPEGPTLDEAYTVIASQSADVEANTPGRKCYFINIDSGRS